MTSGPAASLFFGKGYADSGAVMCSISDLTSETKDTKPWLTIVAKSLTAELVTADNFVGPITGADVVLIETASVPDPAVGKLTLFANLSGQVSTTDSSGDTITLLDNPSSQDQNMNGHSITNILSLAGATNTRLADDIVSNSAPVSSTSNVPVFSDTTGLVIQDSHVYIGHVVTNNAATAVDGNLASFNGTSGIAIHDSGISAANTVTNSGSSVTGNLPSFSSSSGKVVQDSGIPASRVSRSIYSLSVPNPITLSSFTALTSLLTGAVALGSLTFAPNTTQAGSVLRFSAFVQLSIKSGSSITLSLTSGIPFGPTIANSSGSDQGPTGITWTGEMVLFAGGFAVLNSFYGTAWSGATSVSNGGPAGGFWANGFTGTNSIDLQAGFSVSNAGNSVSCASLSFMQLF